MLKKTILAAIALTFVGAPLAQAQSYQQYQKPGHHRVEQNRPGYGKAPHKMDRRKAPPSRHFSKGQRYGDWRQHQEIKDYKRYGLRKPGRDQHWVKVDNQYLLIAGATGLIAGILAAQ